MGTETPQRPRKEAAGSRHEPGLVRQTAPASTDPIGPQTQTLLEEVLRRENLRTALKGLEAARARKATAVSGGGDQPGERLVERGPSSAAGPRTCMRP